MKTIIIIMFVVLLSSNANTYNTDLISFNMSTQDYSYKKDYLSLLELKNSIEHISIKVKGKTGQTTPQFFTVKTKGKIVTIFDLQVSPNIWGEVNITGIGTDIAIIRILAVGLPGRFSSTISFKVIH